MISITAITISFWTSSDDSSINDTSYETTINTIVDHLEPNGTTNNAEHETAYEKNKSIFILSVVVYLCIAFVTTVGNGMVIYAGYGSKNQGPLRYLDDVIRSLAVADMLYGLIGTPMLIEGYYLGKFNIIKIYKILYILELLSLIH